MSSREPADASAPAVGPPGSSDRLRGIPALRLHLTLAGGLVIAVGAFVFEVYRALNGNRLSWLYVFEWPFLGGFGVYMWWHLYNGERPAGDAPAAGSARQAPMTQVAEASATLTGQAAAFDAAPGEAAPARDAESAKLAAWQRYVREMRDAESASEPSPRS